MSIKSSVYTMKKIGFYVCLAFIGHCNTAIAVTPKSTTANVVVKGVVTEPACTIKDVNIDFGEVTTTRIDGVSYKKQFVTPDISCDNPEDSKALQFRISGSLASFGSGLLLTNVPGLGVQFLHGTEIVPLNTGVVKFDYTKGHPTLGVVLAKDPSVALPARDFSATALLAVEYQ